MGTGGAEEREERRVVGRRVIQEDLPGGDQERERSSLRVMGGCKGGGQGQKKWGGSRGVNGNLVEGDGGISQGSGLGL